MNNRHGAQRKRMRKHRRWLVHDAGARRGNPDYLRESVIEARNEGARIPRSFRRHLK